MIVNLEAVYFYQKSLYFELFNNLLNIYIRSLLKNKNFILGLSILSDFRESIMELPNFQVSRASPVNDAENHVDNIERATNILPRYLRRFSSSYERVYKRK